MFQWNELSKSSIEARNWIFVQIINLITKVILVKTSHNWETKFSINQKLLLIVAFQVLFTSSLLIFGKNKSGFRLFVYFFLNHPAPGVLRYFYQIQFLKIIGSLSRILTRIINGFTFSWVVLSQWLSRVFQKINFEKTMQNFALSCFMWV